MDKTEKEMKAFRRLLNKEPLKAEIKTRHRVNYIPISSIQAKLDLVFKCLWSWEITSERVVANEILVRGNLTVTHPVTGQEIVRSGAGASMVRLRKAKEGEPETLPTDIHKKLINACEMDYPKAEAMALTSAAKKLGKFFGRDIGRKPDDVENYTALETNKEQERALKLIEAANVPADIHALSESLPNNKAVQAALDLKLDEIVERIEA